MVDGSQIPSLWLRACEDAGYSPNEVELILASTPTPLDLPRNAYWPPPAVDPAQPPPIVLTEEELAQVTAADGRHRVAVPVGYSEEQTAALMRWALENARQWDYRAGLFEMGAYISASLGAPYSPLGRGGMVATRLIPTSADADAAAAEFVRRTYGPRFGELWGPWGALFRPGHGGTMETLGKRLVVYAAIHADAFDSWVHGPPGRDAVLQDVDDQAPDWWSQLLVDEGFGHLRGSVPYFWPTPEEIKQYDPNPVPAWAPLRDLLLRAQRRGAEVLGGP